MRALVVVGLGEFSFVKPICDCTEEEMVTVAEDQAAVSCRSGEEQTGELLYWSVTPGREEVQKFCDIICGGKSVEEMDALLGDAKVLARHPVTVSMKELFVELCAS